ncbi:MAG: CvpA family protein [Deltaproteobacteria bacterium]|nr:CvpA family protein [Deltaproteobacteria bacterium]MBI3390364.1 CvpA family protein [Deltaproteobacteria bacterium]
MNTLDLALAAVVALFALRGFWRGVFRESFGLLALFGGLFAALEFAASGAEVLEHYVTQPVVREATAFVAIFVVTHGVITIVGVVLDRVAGGGLVSSLAGVAIGAGKGAVLLAFVLLFVHLFPLAPSIDARIMESRLGPPLIGVAGSVMQVGLGVAPATSTNPT